MKTKCRFTWVISSSLIFVLSYFICRYWAFNIHNMKDGPLIIAVLGAVALIISYFFNLKATILCSAFGYIIAFVIGVVLQTDFITYPGGASSNLWHIWLISYLIFILIGVIIDILKKYKNPKTV